MPNITATHASCRGRFAPTPSGPLHAGSLVTALASWLCARKAGGAWLIRIDDLDSARCEDRHATAILAQLEAHGLYWDEAPHYQSRGRGRYMTALETLRATGRLYGCHCTRATLLHDSRTGPDGPVYNGHCRGSPSTAAAARAATRMRVHDGSVSFDDGLQGHLTRDLETEVGDFVVQRADGVIGYHLACAVDEAAMRITQVVRGADLIGSTFCQRSVQEALGLHAPAYAHVPILCDARGRKISKQNHARPLDARHASSNLCEALRLLGQVPTPALEHETPRTILAWALVHWQPEHIPRASAFP